MRPLSEARGDPVDADASRLIRVFAMPGADHGGNPAPVWLDADTLATEDMQVRTRRSGHESVFVLAPSNATDRFRMRYFVPRHEMEMCGHATLAALWWLQRCGRWDGEPVGIETASGRVQGRRVDGLVEISQPRARVVAVGEDLTREIAQCLGVDPEAILAPVLNASTSRVKTLVRLDGPQVLHGLDVDLDSVEALCARLGSTGLYPFATVDRDTAVFSARQFPRSSGYPEDPATGIAAAALAWGLRSMQLIADDETRVTVRQGEAMGSPSTILVRMPSRAFEDDGCWLSGQASDAGAIDASHRARFSVVPMKRAPCLRYAVDPASPLHVGDAEPSTVKDVA